MQFNTYERNNAMPANFKANCRPLLIGSLPVKDHNEAINLVLKYAPEIPLWVQLPFFKEEGMVYQFLPGMPGFAGDPLNFHVDTESGNFDSDLVAFYEEYMAVAEGTADLDSSRFAMKPDTAKGFFVFMDSIESLAEPPAALKAQITGPFTMATGLKDKSGAAVFYNEQLRDAVVKLLALKARWQVKQLKKFGRPVIVFFDEPALTGFGSSEFISISKEDVAKCFEEVVEAVHAEGGLAGIHVCGNTDWPLVLDSPADIVSFDAYSYFDTFVLYPEQIKRFLGAGRIIAWGIVPTLEPEHVEKENVDSLIGQWEEKAARIEALGVDKSVVYGQSLITPACGTGSLSLELAVKVLTLTGGVSKNVREKI